MLSLIQHYYNQFNRLAQLLSETSIETSIVPGALASLVGYRHKLQKIIANKHTLSITCFCLLVRRLAHCFYYLMEMVFIENYFLGRSLATILFAIIPSLAQKLARYRDKVKHTAV